MMIAPGRNEMNGAINAKTNTISGILEKYRKQVNQNLLFICVDLNGSGHSLVNLDEGEKHPNDILITGWSDQILRYIAERGTSQLDVVEKIDITKGLGVKVDAGAGTSNAPQMKKNFKNKSEYKKGKTAVVEPEVVAKVDVEVKPMEK